MSEPPGVPASPVPEAAYETPEAVAARLSGRPPTPNERAEAAFYGSLRPALLAARDDAGLSQSGLAEVLEMGQSEVSRLETSVGPRTRLGRIRDYLAGCGARLALVVSTATGRSFAVGEAEGDPAAPSSDPADTVMAPATDLEWIIDEGSGAWVFRDTATRLGSNIPNSNIQGHVAGVGFSAREGALIDHILALDDAMAGVGLPPAQATQVRHAFLTRLRPGQATVQTTGQATRKPAGPAAEPAPHSLQRG